MAKSKRIGIISFAEYAALPLESGVISNVEVMAPAAVPATKSKKSDRRTFGFLANSCNLPSMY